MKVWGVNEDEGKSESGQRQGRGITKRSKKSQSWSFRGASGYERQGAGKTQERAEATGARVRRLRRGLAARGSGQEKQGAGEALCSGWVPKRGVQAASSLIQLSMVRINYLFSMGR